MPIFLGGRIFGSLSKRKSGYYEKFKEQCIYQGNTVVFIDKITVKKEGKYGTCNDVCMYTGTEDMKRK